MPTREELIQQQRDDQKRTVRKAIISIVIVALIIGFWVLAAETSGNVDGGTYVIKQAAVTGEMSAIMKPGWFFKNWGNVTVWPVGETFYFTSADGNHITGNHIEYQAIEVRFNDGAVCRISGTCRLDMPADPKTAIDLVTKQGFQSHEQLEQKLILPTLRRALILTANLMSSKESYDNKRLDFISWAGDQVANGIYKTKDETITTVDPVSGEKVTKTRKGILTDTNGKIVRETNPLEGTGITLSLFEVKDFGYDATVTAQIASQQQAIQAVNLAIANAKKAAQDSITAKALGEAVVTKAEYEEKEKKIRAEVKANQEASVATIEAQKLLDVAALTQKTAIVAATQEKEVAAVALEAASLKKKTAIEIATGESEARRMVLNADGALAQKLQALVEINGKWAAAYATHPVPSIQMGATGAGGGDTSEAQRTMELIQLQATKALLLDSTIKAPTAPVK